MKSYRDYLDKRDVPRGPWVTNEHGVAVVERQAERQPVPQKRLEAPSGSDQHE